MQVLILGTGDAFTRRHFGASAVIAPSGFHASNADTPSYVMIDCPDPIHRVLHEAGNNHGMNLEVIQINDILLTHLHGDHSNGLESFGFWRRIARSRGMDDIVPRIYTTAPVADRLWEKLAPAMDAPYREEGPSSLDTYFDIRIVEPGSPFTICGLEIECRFTGHPIPTTGLLIKENDSCLGWSGDTPFEQAHVDWLSPADVIVHESNLGDAHTPIERLEKLPEDLREKIHLIHLPDDFDHASTSMKILSDGQLLNFDTSIKNASANTEAIGD